MRVKNSLLELGMQLRWLHGAEVGAPNCAMEICLAWPTTRRI